jgi:glycosyltransferase involved in cell wall biosynthesis
MMAEAHFPGKLALQQRVMTAYRTPFFEALAKACEGGLSLCAGLPRPEEAITTTNQLYFPDFTQVENIHLLKGAFYICYQRGLLSWLERSNPDALIVEANPRYLTTAAAINWMKKRHRPVLAWGLGAPALSGPLSGLRKSRRISFLSRFDALLTYSRRGADEYAALGYSFDRIFVAPNAVAGRPSSQIPSQPAEFSEKPVVLFVGRLQARKRLDLLLQSCALLPAPIQPRLIIVGDGPERNALEKLSKTIYPSAEFPGAKYRDELAAIFSIADLFVLPGTGGLAVQEAMSYGLPIIMGQGDGTNDHLVRPENGWLIPADNPSVLTETLREALQDVQRLRNMGVESYRIVAEEVNVEKMVEVFIAALNSVKS